MRYIAYIRKDPNSDYGVDFPDLPGCISAGSTIEEAHSMAREAAAVYVEYLNEESRSLPRASSLDDLKNDPYRKDAAVCFVDVTKHSAPRRK